MKNNNWEIKTIDRNENTKNSAYLCKKSESPQNVLKALVRKAMNRDQEHQWIHSKNVECENQKIHLKDTV
jgi:hypothetical protein